MHHFARPDRHSIGSLPPTPCLFSFVAWQHLREAGLTTPNLWFGVYDFNDEAKTGDNWRLLNEGLRVTRDDVGCCSCRLLLLICPCPSCRNFLDFWAV